MLPRRDKKAVCGASPTDIGDWVNCPKRASQDRP